MRRILTVVATIIAFTHSAHAIDTKAKQAFLVDYDTGAVMLAKEADTQMHPSSMSKLMTTYILSKKLAEGRIKPTDMLKVSEKAWKTQGSKTFVHVGGEVSVDDLHKGIIIQSGNDACIVLAEGISGSEEAFAQLMNQTAAELGMKNSHFVNATGWPDEGHMMTARDLATLARHVISDFPADYPYYAEKEFTYNNIKQENRNRLLGNDIGVDGLKTGHTEAGGYGIVLSAKHPQTARRVILVINGLESDNDRVEEGDKLLRWAFREFENKTIVKAGELVENADVWFGTAPNVGLTAEKDVLVTLPINAQKDVKFTLKYNGPVPAPITKGTHVADLLVNIPAGEPIVVPLVAAEDVAALGGFARAKAVVMHYVFGK